MNNQEIIQNRLSHLCDMSEILMNLADLSHSMFDQKECTVSPELQKMAIKILANVQTMVSEIWIEGPPATE